MFIPEATCLTVEAVWKGDLQCLFPRKCLGILPIMASCRHFTVYMQMLEPCLVDFVSFHSHLSNPSYVHTICYSFTGLLVTLLLSSHSQFTVLTCPTILPAKISLSHLSRYHLSQADIVPQTESSDRRNQTQFFNRLMCSQHYLLNSRIDSNTVRAP